MKAQASIWDKWKKKVLNKLNCHYHVLLSVTITHPTPPPNTSPNIIHIGPQDIHCLFRLWLRTSLSVLGKKNGRGKPQEGLPMEEVLVRVLGQSCKEWLKSWATTPGTILSLLCFVSHLSGVEVRPSAISTPTKNRLPPGRTHSPFPVSHLRQWFKVLKGREMIHAN